MRHKILLGVMLAAALAWSGAARSVHAENYPDYQSAMRAASPFMKARDYKSAQAPLEAALKLATNDKERLTTYNNLMPAYRLLTENDKMIEACEFTMAKTREDAERSITARSLGSFLFQRGKLDDARKKYEAVIAKEPGDLVALSMLTVIAGAHRDDKELEKKYQAELDKARQQRAATLADEEEALVAIDPKQATNHWKQAAIYRVRAAQPTKAIEDAKQAELSGPDKRSEILEHFWHAQLGDVYLQAGAPEDAVRHFERAIATTTTAGYKTACEKKLAEAKAKLAEKK